MASISRCTPDAAAAEVLAHQRGQRGRVADRRQRVDLFGRRRSLVGAVRTGSGGAPLVTRLGGGVGCVGRPSGQPPRGSVSVTTAVAVRSPAVELTAVPAPSPDGRRLVQGPADVVCVVDPAVGVGQPVARPPHCAAMISAAMQTAVSSGVRAPRSSPIGRGQPGQLLLGQAGLAQPLEPVVVGAPRAHRADVGDLGSRSATSSTGTSNFGSWVSTQITVRPSIRPAVDLGLEVPVRPVDDDLVGVREPASRWRTPAARRTP